MSFLMVVAVFPLLLAMLTLGTGLLVERLCGLRLPAALLPALGFAVLIVVSQFATWTATLAPATPWILAGLALSGFALGWRTGVAARWRARGSWWWTTPAAGVAAYLTVSAPVIAAGRLTFPGYLVDSTGAIQLAGAERLLHHGRNFLAGPSVYGSTLNAYFGHGYPSGAHSVLASTGWLSGQDLLWLYAPFQAMELALAALVLSFLARRAGLTRPAAAFAGWIAAVPALVSAYAQMGSIKELTVLPMLLLMGALVVLAPEMARARSPRAVLPFALAGAAALGAIGVAASPWVVLFALAGLLPAALALPAGRHGYRALAAGTVALGGATALLALPTLGPLSSSLSLARSLQGSNPVAAADPGNLLRPLREVQALGVWLGGTHRLDPRYFNQTYLLIGIVAVCIALGLIVLVRRRAWGLLGFVAVSFVVWRLLASRGTEWTDAKVLMLLSPVALLVAMIGAFGASGGRRLEGMLLAGVLAFGVLASDALLYHGTGLAPTQRYVELRTLGQRYAGQGPVLLTDFDEYAIYLMRDSLPEGPGFAYRGPFALVGGGEPPYGHSYDLDSIAQRTLQRYRLIVMRNSPTWSRPPSNYALIWSGLSYQVWRRAGTAPLAHLSLGGGLQPVAQAPCARVRTMAQAALRVSGSGSGELLAAVRPPNLLVDLSTAGHSPNAGLVPDLESMPAMSFSGPARVQTAFRVSTPGRYQLWLGGDVDRPLHVLLDKRQVGAPSAQFGGDASRYPVATVWLSAGRHALEFLREGGTPSPGDDASTLIDGVIFEPLQATHERVVSVAPSAWRSLCHRPLDWVEAR
jgi:hypothetical protein